MRTLVTADGFGEDDVKSLFKGDVVEIGSASEAMKAHAFSGLFRGSPFEVEAG